MKRILSIALVVLMITSAVSALATTNDNLLYFLNSEECVGWQVKETRNLQPGFICIGDVIVSGVIRYDEGGIGQDTVVINFSQKPVSINAPYGAQEQRFVEAKVEDVIHQLALQEFNRIEKKNETYQYMFHTIRFVIIDSQGQVGELYVPRVDFFK